MEDICETPVTTSPNTGGATRSAVTVVIATWNSLPDLGECMETLFSQDYPNFRVLVVDSGSSDGTPEFVRGKYPDVEVIACKENLGYRRANALGCGRCKSDYVLVLNDDVELEPHWLSAMVGYMEDHPRAGLATPLILLASDRGLVNAAGNALQFTGMYSGRGKGRPRAEFTASGPVSAVSGCCFIARRKLLDQIGGFSSDFDAYDTGWHASFEDADLSFRAWMAGYEVAFVAESAMWHKYTQRPMHRQRFLAYEFGRYLLAVRNFEPMTLLRLLPLLLILEAMTLTYAARRGPSWVAGKIRLWFWMVRSAGLLRQMRARIQPLRQVSDRVVLRQLSPDLAISGAPRFIEGALNRLFRLYFRLVF